MTWPPDGAARTAPGSAHTGSLGPLRAPRILLVDDDVALLDILSSALEAAGCTVLVATTGETGLEAARRARPDLVVLDVVLPDDDGFAICARLTRDPLTRETPVVLLTTLEAADGAEHGRAAGAADYIEKRPPWVDVVARIRSQLGRGG